MYEGLHRPRVDLQGQPAVGQHLDAGQAPWGTGMVSRGSGGISLGPWVYFGTSEGMRGLIWREARALRRANDTVVASRRGHALRRGTSSHSSCCILQAARFSRQGTCAAVRSQKRNHVRRMPSRMC